MLRGTALRCRGGSFLCCFSELRNQCGAPSSVLLLIAVTVGGRWNREIIYIRKAIIEWEKYS